MTARTHARDERTVTGRARSVIVAFVGLVAVLAFAGPDVLARSVSSAPTPAAIDVPGSTVGSRSLNPGDVSITLLSGTSFLLDSNKPCTEGPNASYVGFRIVNTSGGTLTGLEASLGGLAAGFTLAGGQQDTQYVGTLAAGAARSVYFYVEYPCTSGQSSSFVLTVTDDNPGSVSDSVTITTERAISANAGGLLTSINLGPNAILGQIIDYEVTYSFGNTAPGDEFFIQPSGDPLFRADCFQLIGAQVLTSDVNAISAGSVDWLNFVASGRQGGTDHRVTVLYQFKYLCSGVSSTAVPFAGQTSGSDYKYTGNFETFPSFQPFPSGSNPFVVEKNTNPTALSSGGTVRYTVRIINASMSGITSYVDEVRDVLPPGVQFIALAPSSDITAANSSAVPGAGETGSITFQSIPATTWAVAGSDTLRLVYDVSVPDILGDYTNAVSATSGNEIVGSDAVTVTIGPNADLTVSKSGPASVALGDTLTYTIDVTNLGPDDAPAVEISDLLPGSGSFVSASDGGTESGGTVTWNPIPVLAAGASVQYTVRFAPSSGPITNIASAQSAIADPDVTNNDGSDPDSRVTTTVVAGTLTGVVYDDTNGNGVRDAGEAGLAGIDVVVTDAFGVSRTVSTDAGGDWVAGNLPGGSATVDIDESSLPAGAVQTAGTDPNNVTVVAGSSESAGTDGYQSQGGLTGNVFEDANGNGVRDAGEFGLTGVDVVIVDALGDTTTVATDANGDWAANGLPTGSATVDVDDTTLPAGSALTAGTDPSTVTVVAGSAENAGTDAYQMQGALTGLIYNDLNGNGAQDAGEGGLAGVDVVITDALGGTTTVSTNTDGNWTASGLPTGSATVNIDETSLPAGAVQTVGTDPTAATVVAGSTEDAGTDAYQLRGELTGVVFEDANGNGVQDAGEEGLVGIDIVITDALGDSTAVITGADGTWTATGLPTGSASVDITDASLPTGAVQTGGTDPSSATVVAGASEDAGADAYQMQGAVTGRVFDDANGNGVQDAGESGLAGVDVVITDVLGGSSTVTTNADGDWTASGLPAGAATIDIDETSLPAGAVQTAGTDPSSATVVAGSSEDAGDDAFQMQGALTGRVFDDTNGNGVQDAGEGGLAGVNVVITDALGGSSTVTTNADGDWTASGLPTGAATIDIDETSLPPGAARTAGTDPTSATVIPGSTENAGTVAYQMQGVLTGRVYDDANGNGVQDAGESGLPGIDILITDALGASSTATTNADGDWTAGGLPAGSASIDVDDATLPAGATLTAGADPDAITVVAGSTEDAGTDAYQMQGSLAGRVFEDANGNGVQDVGEPGLAGVDVVVTDALGGLTTVTSDADGNWTAAGLPVGSATADIDEASLPAGAARTAGTDPSTATVIAGSTEDAGTDAFQLLGALTGRVFDDANGNGVEDIGESGIAGVDIVITDAQTGVRTATTGADGNWTSSGLPTGPATVDVDDASLPVGAVLTAGADPNTVTVVAGSSESAGTDAYQQQGAVTGHVFEDTNGNGVQDPGEPGLAGVDVVITDALGVSTTVTTDADGDWTASGLPAGMTTVDIDDATLPVGSTRSTGMDPSTVTVIPGSNSNAAAVGYEPAPNTGTLTGRVFDDANGNGVQDAGEAGLPGVDVVITDSGSGATTATTDADGNWTANGLPTGSASADVDETSLPPGAVQTAGTDPSSATVVAGATEDAGTDAYQMQGALTGRVFEDTNGNGVQDPGEPGLAGVDVVITDAQGGSTTVTTNADGDWSASSLPGGSASVDLDGATLPAGATLTAGADPNTVTVIAGSTEDGGTTAYQMQGSLAGRVFEDANGNGVQDAGEVGLSGVEVVVTDAQGGTTTVTTNADGDWTASGLPAGSATVDIDETTLPAGTARTAGTDPTSATVVAGSDGDAGTVAYQIQGALTGRVFDDTNGNGVQEAGESGLAGINVVVTDAQGGTTTVTTDLNGDWTATGLPTGSATVDIDETTLPAGAARTAGADPTSATVVAGSTEDGGTAAYQMQGALTGRVFDDANGNGVQDAGEVGLSGVEVVVTDTQGGSTTVTTNADGDWTASGLPVGAASIDIDESSLPAGTTMTAGTDPNSVAVVAGSSTDAGTNAYQLQGTLTGHVFEDTNGNGVQDAGEPGEAGVDILITDAQGGTTTVTTDADGDWTAVGLPAGSATVDIVDGTLPAGSMRTTGIDPSTVAVVAGESTNTDPVGYEPAPDTGTLTGRVFDDANGNGMQDAGEPGIAGVLLVVTDAYGGLTTVTTDADGDWTANGLPAGSATVDIDETSLPAGATRTSGVDPNAVTVVAGSSEDTGSVSYQMQGALSGRVFEDTNGNGVQDAGESGLAGVVVVISDAQGGSTTVTTDADGDWTASDRPAGSATVAIDETSLPAGATLTAGTDPSAVTVVAGSSATAGAVAYQRQGALTGHVFEDGNGNGVQDAGEPGEAGVDIVVTDAQGNSTIVTTNADGDWTLSGLPTGSATVDIVDGTLPAGSTRTAGIDPTTVTVVAGAIASSDPVGYKPAPDTGTLTGRLFDDVNGNGIMEAGEYGLEGVDIVITDAQGGSTIVTTDANGNWTANALPSGPATVRIDETSLPAGAVRTAGTDPSAVTVVAGSITDAGTDAFQLQGDLAGSVFEDVNGNGVRDAGEPGLAGVRVEITDAGGTTITVTTDADGNWTAAGLPSGTATLDIQETSLPVGATRTAGTNPSSVTVIAGSSANAGADPYQRQGALIGHVFEDTNGNGVQDAGEPGEAGVRIVITDAQGDTTIVTTNADGDWTAIGLPAGSATVDILDTTLPAGSTRTVGVDPATVTVVPGSSASSDPVGYEPAPDTGTLVGRVFEDTNGNGIRDADESGLAGVNVVITDAVGGTRVVMTDANGNWTANGLPTGSATVKIDRTSLPPGASLTAGADPSAVTVVSGSTGDAGTDAYQMQGALSGSVFDDTNGNGVRDAGEPGLAGIRVAITDALGTTRLVTTDADGIWTAHGLPAGSATVDIDQASLPPGATMTAGSDPGLVSVTAGSIEDAGTDAYQMQGILTGRVFDDANGNGTQDAGEAGLAGVDIVITDALGSTRTVTTDADGAWTAAGLPAGPATVDVDESSLPAGAVQTAGTDPSTATVEAGSSRDAGANGYRDTILANADIEILKQGPSDAQPGAEISYTVTVTNNGPADATDVVVSDLVPDAAAFVRAGSGGAIDDGIVSWPSIELLAPDETVSYEIVLQAPDSGVITNVASATATSPDLDPSNNDGSDLSNQVTTSILGRANLAITKTAPESAVVGDTISYSIIVTNFGPDAARDLLVVDTLPTSSGASVTALSDGAVMSGDIVSWSVSHLAPGESLEQTLKLVAEEAGELVNKASVTSSTDDPSPDNNEDTAGTNVSSGLDLALTKSTEGVFRIGGQGVYTLTVTNEGASASTGPVSVIDILPNGMSLIEAAGEDWTFQNDGQVVTATRETPIDPGEESAVRLTVSIDAGIESPVSNTATVSATADVRASNNSSSATTPVEMVDITLHKEAAGDFEVGKAGTYVLTVKNNGQSPTIGPVTVEDALPEGLSYLSARGNGWSFTYENGTVSATYEAVLDTGDSASFTLNVMIGHAALPTVENVASVRTAGLRVGNPGRISSSGPVSVTGQSNLIVTKSASRKDVEVTDVVDYTITVTNAGDAPSTDTRVLDELPTGFSYVVGSTRIDGSAAPDPSGGSGPSIEYELGDLSAGARRTIMYRLLVGPSALLGDGRNTAVATDGSTGSASAVSVATVNVRAGVFGDEAAIFGTVYAECDCEVEEWQTGDASRDSSAFSDSAQYGIPGVRVVLQDGTSAVTDAEGQYHFEALSPRSYVVRVDEMTLPAGAKLIPHSNIHAGDGVTLFADLKRGDLYRADFSVKTDDPHKRPAAVDDRDQGPRPMLISGLLEARLDLRSIAKGDLRTGGRDRFEDELRAISSGDDEHVTAGARAAVLAQGSLSDDVELTLRLDTEDDERARLFRDIRPNEFYDTYGDASIREFDAQSKGRFFGRLQSDRSFLQYGDFTTSDPHGASVASPQLGRFVRTLNGMLGHLESETATVNAFASRDRFRQVVDEIPGQGVSGPYGLSRSDGLVNSERVEIITRDRNQPSIVLKAEPMQRFLDYRLEPLTGRLIFMRPVPSVDADLNPVTIRVSYETESGGDSFWVTGAGGQYTAVEELTVGATYVRDENPSAMFELMGANASVDLGAGTFLTGEYARTESAGALSGDAFRLELRASPKDIETRFFYLDTDESFMNPSARAFRGRREAGIRTQAALGPKTRLMGEAIWTEDLIRNGTRKGAHVSLEHAFRTWLRAELGLRASDESRQAAGALTEDVTPNEFRSLRAKLTSDLPWFEDANVYGEYEQVLERSNRRAAVGGDYSMFGRARVYGRHEMISSFAGPYALNSSQTQNTTVVGVAAEYMDSQSVFSEYRIRDAFSGREAQAAIGLRNLWSVAEGLRVHTSLERVAPISGGTNNSFAVTGAVEYTNNPLWRGSARAEYRSATDGGSTFGSLGYARRLSREFSLIGNTEISVMASGDRALERTRLGVAYREADRNRTTALARYEHRYDLHPGQESGQKATRTAHIVSSHVNRRLIAGTTVSGRWASKWANESSSGIDVAESAHLVAVRLRHDLTRLIDIGATGRSLFDAGFESVTWGFGGEVGALVVDNLRVAAGYNVFGFTDKELSTEAQTDRGFHVHVGFKFDESIFGIGRPNTP